MDRELTSTTLDRSSNGRTIAKLAKVAGVGHGTIHKVQVIKEAVEDGAIAPEVEQELRAVITSINKVYQEAKEVIWLRSSRIFTSPSPA